ncbi:MAG TPA: hypothetical protein VGX23_09245 [Actinocrinis sp.]|nr:hypothetical protein [Actinocrinis sp.]
MSDHVHQVIVTREDGAWLADVPELEGAHTFARSLPSLDEAIREVIVLAADLPDEAMPDLELDFEYRTGDPRIDQDAARVRRMRSQLAEVESLTAESIYALTPELSVRDAGVLLGVSPQRVSQVAGKHRLSRQRTTAGAMLASGASSPGKKAAKKTGKQLRGPKAAKAEKSAAASDLAQADTKK